MRRLLALPLVALLVLAACGPSTTTAGPSGGSSGPSASAGVVPGSAAPTDSSAPAATAAPTPDPNAEPTPPGGDTGEIPSDAAATPEPTASPSPAVPLTGCAKINDAIETIDMYLQFFTQADDTTWADFTGKDSPIGFEQAKFKKAIAALAKDPAMKTAGAQLRSLDKVLGQALASDAPFASSAAPGSVLVRASNRNFVSIETALVAVRAAHGCG